MPIQPKTSNILPKFCQKLATTLRVAWLHGAAAPESPSSPASDSVPDLDDQLLSDCGELCRKFCAQTRCQTFFSSLVSKNLPKDSFSSWYTDDDDDGGGGGGGDDDAAADHDDDDDDDNDDDADV